MRQYSVALCDALAAVIDEMRRRERKSITEVFIWALEKLAVSEGLVRDVIELYTGYGKDDGMMKSEMEAAKKVDAEMLNYSS